MKRSQVSLSLLLNVVLIVIVVVHTIQLRRELHDIKQLLNVVSANRRTIRQQQQLQEACVEQVVDLRVERAILAAKVEGNVASLEGLSQIRERIKQLEANQPGN